MNATRILAGCLGLLGTLSGCDRVPGEGPAKTVEVRDTPKGTNTAPKADETAKRARPVTRLFYQDLETSSLKWADLRVDGGNAFVLDTPGPIGGFPKIDAAKQKLVQMKETGGWLCVGIRDESDGKHASGWAIVRSGVDYVDHGDHGHWTFKNGPDVADHRIDDKQGNPAHLYVYDKRFFLANDKLNGYTRIDPAGYGDLRKDTPRFLVGGGNHITLAVVDDKVGYSAWIDGGGPDKGRVDVTPVTGSSRTEPAYRFHLPTGGIHGAIANSGKVFFAPLDGICWVEADIALNRKPEQVVVHHVPLGKDGEKPCRTGAFVNHGHTVLFVTGKEANSRLVVLNAKEADPKPVFLGLNVQKGTQALTPEIAVTPQGKVYAFVFHDRAKDIEAEDRLDVIDLDPNSDGDCSDLKLEKTLIVGKSCVEGHSGHHAIAFDAEKRIAIIANPGDGTLMILSLKTLEFMKTFQIKGQPSALIAVGSKETSH